MNEKEEKEVWYGFCTYWTDEWDKLAATSTGRDGMLGAIPCCPKCGSPGFQVTLREWNAGVKRVENEYPGYAKFIAGLKNTCYGKGVGIGDLWEKKKEVMNGRQRQTGGEGEKDR